MPFIPPLLRLLAPLPAHFSVFFISSLFVSLHARILSPSLSLSDPSSVRLLKSKLAEDRGHYRVSIVRRSVSTLAKRSTLLPPFPSTSLFSPLFPFDISTRWRETSREFLPPRKKMLFFSSRYLESNRRTDERGILKKLVRKERRKKSDGGEIGKFKILLTPLIL